MTTEASGFWTSALDLGAGPRRHGHGHEAKGCDERRHEHGPQADPGALEGRLRSRQPLVVALLHVGDEHEAVEDGDAKQGDEPYAGRDGERHPAQRERDHPPPVTAKGTFR